MNNNQTPVRCRFAPSPTGSLHLGGARTALFNYLFAKHNNGTFILRIEDTDKQRSTPEATQTILDGLRWLELEADEGPIFQSQREELHCQYAKQLLATGDAYPCYCTTEELDAMREEARKNGSKQSYNNKYRPKEKLPLEPILPTGKDQRPFVIRLRTPLDGATVFNDQILGIIETGNEELDDFVIVRSDGAPTYNFVVVVDDIEMQITHVIRGLDHVSNTPKQILVYQALGAQIPVFAHVPMILGEDKKKLSKRHGATSVFEYKDKGYLPEAFLNYLARLGWSHGDQEIFTREELIAAFSLSSVGKSPAVFDFAKLEWVNAEHIRKMNFKELAAALAEILSIPESQLLKLENNEAFLKLFEQLKERARTLHDLAGACSWVVNTDHPLAYDAELTQKLVTADIKEALSSFSSKLQTIVTFTETEIEAAFNQILVDHNLKFGKLGQPVRFALTGIPMGAPIPAIILALGKDLTSARFQALINAS